MRQAKYERRDKARDKRRSHLGSSGKSVFLLQEILIRKGEAIRKARKAQAE